MAQIYTHRELNETLEFSHPEAQRCIITKSSNSSVDALRQVAEPTFCSKTSHSYHPIDLARLTPRMFLYHLLDLTNTLGNKMYLKSYGGHRSVLMMLFNDCDATRTVRHELEEGIHFAHSKRTLLVAEPVTFAMCLRTRSTPSL